MVTSAAVPGTSTVSRLWYHKELAPVLVLEPALGWLLLLVLALELKLRLALIPGLGLGLVQLQGEVLNTCWQQNWNWDCYQY